MQPSGDGRGRAAQEKTVTSNKLEIIAEPGKTDIVTRRTVDAPRALVYEAFTKPEYIRRWMGPSNLALVTCELDLRVGGQWRYVHRAPDGTDYPFHGRFLELDPPGRLVRTFLFGPMKEEDAAVETLTLEEKDGKTTITTLSVHTSSLGRDRHLAGGAMEHGMTEGYQRMDELLAEIKPK